MTRLTAALILVAAAAAAEAQTLTPPRQDTVSGGTLDLSVPESPAFTVLNLTPQDVARPGSPTALATTVLSGVDRQGNFQSGFALDVSPYMIWHGNNVTLQTYRDSPLTRFFMRAQLSAAVVKGAAAGDKSAKVGVGGRFILFDLDDARTDSTFATALATIGAMVLDEVDPPAPDANGNINLTARAEWEARAAARAEELSRALREGRRSATWNPTSLVVGFAGEMLSAEGRVQDVSWQGGAAWMSLGYGFDTVPRLQENAHVILHARVRGDGDDAASAAEPSPDIREKWLVGARLRFGGKNGTLSFESSRLRPLNETEVASRFSLSVERRLAGQTWIELSVGGQGKSGGTGAETFVLSQVKWSFVER